MQLFPDSAFEVDDPFLRHAVSLAVRARGQAAPNPLVGCVVVLDGRIVGEGYHPRAGEPHAEVFALADAGELARGADAYVTLEPCRHHGRTPPCTDALIAAGVKRVVIGMPDPNAEAAGGAAVLREAGIEVVFAEDPTPFAEINAGWLKRLASGLPLVRVKVALSLDGRPALEPGVCASMTGESGARVTRMLRSASDAVLVGVSTLDVDDPALTVRDAAGALAEHQPLRVVLARSRPPRADARVFTDNTGPALLIAPDNLDASGIDSALVERYPADAGLRAALRRLGDRGVNELLVEAGPRLFTALWQKGLIDELVVVSAGGLAGSGAPALFEVAEKPGTEVLEHRFEPVKTGIVGDVTATVWRPASAAVIENSTARRGS